MDFLSLKSTVCYKQIDDFVLSCDIYTPAKCNNGHIILWLHHGGFISGSRNDLPTYQLDRYLEAGFTVASIDYRLAPETKLPQIIEDVEDSFAWLKEKFPDSQGFCVIGHSAGGYLSLYLSMKYDEIKAVVSFYGYGSVLDTWVCTPSAHYLNFPPISYEEAQDSIGSNRMDDADALFSRFTFYFYCRQLGEWANAIFGKDISNALGQYLQYSPIFHLHSDMPPTLLIHAKDDWDVPFDQSQAFQLSSRQYGNECLLIELEEGGHMFDMIFEGEPSEHAVTTVEQVVSFLKSKVLVD